MLLDYFKAKGMLDRYGIRSVRSAYINTAEDAIRFAADMPMAMKVLSEKQLHKSKAGLVRLDLSGEEEIAEAFRELQAKGKRIAPYRIIAQEMSEKGIEVIIGGREDQLFGKLILIGLGGIYVEAFRDFALRVCPITRYDAAEMLAQLRSGNVITYNGKNASMLSDLLIRTSKLLSENKEIRELDLNPVMLREKDYDVVDIRVISGDADEK